MRDYLNHLVEPTAQDIQDAMQSELLSEQEVFNQEQATLFLRDQYKDQQPMENQDSRDRYDIVRMYKNKWQGRIILRGLTLQEAQAHCSNPETSSKTCTSAKSKAITKRNGEWFDSYRKQQ